MGSLNPLLLQKEWAPMSMAEANFLRLLRVWGSNIGIAILAVVAWGVINSFSGIPFIVMLFVISLLQGGLMVCAFGPAVGSERWLSTGGKIIGWIGFIGWFLIHLLNAGMKATGTTSNGLQTVVVELIFYLVINTLALAGFYKELFYRPRPMPIDYSARDEEEALRERERRNAETEQRDLKKRCNDARFACQLLYDSHRALLNKRFPPEQFQDYFARYLSDSFPVNEVESRAQKLQTLIQGFIDADGAGKKSFQSLVEIRAFYQKQRESVEQSDLDEITRQSLWSDLALEEERAIREFRQR